MRTLFVILALAVVAPSLAACRQASCAWQTTTQCVGGVTECDPRPSDCRAPYIEPIYDVDCGRGREQMGHGAFAHSPR